jgi:hypothetical protein
MLRRRRCPIPTDDGALWVCYFASAEIGCQLALGWDLPTHVIDLYVEHRITTNSDVKVHRGLADAMGHRGLDAMDAAYKEANRELAIRGGPFTTDERAQLIRYNACDVQGTADLFLAMLPEILTPPPSPRVSLGRALYRGRYMRAVGRMEHEGVPIDVDTWRRLEANWDAIKAELVAEVDARYGVYKGTTFKAARFMEYTRSQGIVWPIHPNGIPDLRRDTFRTMVGLHPYLRPLYDVRFALSELRIADLAVGPDGRNRTLLSPYASKTGRNLPSSTKFIFGPSSWLRSLIKPPKGMAVAYVDWSQQELGIAAALSGDQALAAAYHSGDPYLAFAIDAGLAPPGATKEAHGAIRDACKACVLGMGYGMGQRTLAGRIGQSEFAAHRLLAAHRRTYPVFWRWVDRVIATTNLCGSIETAFGWRLQTIHEFNPRAVQNFPCQAHGSEILRLTCCYMTEVGIRVAAPVHDAVLIVAPTDEIDDQVRAARALMARASRVVLQNFELRTDVKVTRWPDRIVDDRNDAGTWDRVMRILDRVENGGGVASTRPQGTHWGYPVGSYRRDP